VLQNFIDKIDPAEGKIEIMPGSTDWSTLDYDPLQQWIESGIAREKAE
jgi:hypothetical protein